MSTFIKLSMLQLKEKLKAAANLDFPYMDRVQRDLSDDILVSHLEVPASVLLLFAFDQEQCVNLLLIKRTDLAKDAHRGQMAFPGGRSEVGEDSWDTALREATEEVGINSKKVLKIGELPSLLTVTGFLVQPKIGIYEEQIEKVKLKLDHEEIAEVAWISLKILLDPKTYRLEMYPARGKEYPIHVYLVPPYRIWGATGSMIKNLLDRLLALG